MFAMTGGKQYYLQLHAVYLPKISSLLSPAFCTNVKIPRRTNAAFNSLMLPDTPSHPHQHSAHNWEEVNGSMIEYLLYMQKYHVALYAEVPCSVFGIFC